MLKHQKRSRSVASNDNLAVIAS